MKDNQNRANPLKLALIQFDIIWENSDENLKMIAALLENLTNQPDVIVLPETFNTGFSMEPSKVAESMHGKTIEWMKELSTKMQCAVCGSLFIEEDRKYFNRFIWVEPDGKIVQYDKRHLFSMGNESQHYTAGKTQTVIEYKGWRIFPQICYDLRFPVWSRNTMNYDLLINVANWPASRNKVWKTLLKARAIENQCYVAALNRLGTDGNGINYIGNSMITGPKGEVLMKAKSKSGILNAEIDFTELQQFRSKFNTLKDADTFNILP